MTPARKAEIRQEASHRADADRTMLLEMLETIEQAERTNRRLRAAIPVDARRAEAMAEHIDDALEILRNLKLRGASIHLGDNRNAYERLEGELVAAQRAFDQAGDTPLELLEEALERLKDTDGAPMTRPEIDGLLSRLGRTRDR